MLLCTHNKFGYLKRPLCRMKNISKAKIDNNIKQAFNDEYQL